MFCNDDKFLNNEKDLTKGRRREILPISKKYLLPMCHSIVRMFQYKTHVFNLNNKLTFDLQLVNITNSS